MEVGDNLKELNMTKGEIEKLSKAFKDDKFKEMLREYVQEISDPDNRKKYEEEIKLLERERGNSLEFIHPEPFRALKTSVNGKQTCFINICGNDKVGKPECQCGVSEDGRRGQSWSLPHSLHPGRPDADAKGNKAMIYDVVFHPDTLHIACTSEKFMEMVVKTALQGIQSSFSVRLDENNVRPMSTKYKGSPQPCVIRRPIPGYKAKQPSENADPLSFPYPDEKRPAIPSQSKPATENSGLSFQVQLQKANEPTKPNYTVKYRSVIDLQDYRCSRDSTKSPRPKAIVVTIDLPLVKSVTGASLEVKERRLLLETQKPAYRLELPLAYPVDDDKGEAKFNKQTGQLIVTLPVLPSNEAYSFALASVSDVQSVNGSEESEDEKRTQEQGHNSEEENEEEGKATDLRQHTGVKKGDDDDERGQERGKGQMRNSLEIVQAKGQIVGENEERVEQERGVEMRKSDETESGQERKDGEQARKTHEENSIKTVSEKETWGECDGAAENREMDIVAHLNTCLASTHKIKTSDTQRETDNTDETVDSALKVEEEAAFPNRTSSEESQATAAVAFTIPASSSSHIVKDCSISQGNEEFNRVPVTGEEKPEGSGSGPALFSEEVTVVSGNQEREDIDEDDLPAEHKDEPPAAVLREIDEHGNEKIISDHSTSAGIPFQNTLMYELD